MKRKYSYNKVGELRWSLSKLRKTTIVEGSIAGFGYLFTGDII